MTRIVVLSAPRSGTHMLVRMISKALQLPWQINIALNEINSIKYESWVVGIHQKYNLVYEFLPKNVKIICIKRNYGHQASLKNFSPIPLLNIEEIINSFPDNLTVTYDEIIKESESELKKINKILNTNNIEYEQWEKRYYGFSDWRSKKYDENNPELI